MSSAAMGPAYAYPGGRTEHSAHLPPRPLSTVTAAQPIAPVKEPAKVPQPGGGAHRSVLGSGLVSSAVQEAQVRARLKAENFAKDRKRKRTEEPVEPVKVERVSEEDSKLSPDELKKKRYQRRLALNRESAAVSRVRRREYVKLLEEQLVNAEKERVRLATELSNMQKEHNKLREHLQKLEGRIEEPDN